MSVYRIFPTQDATIYSSTPDKNSGLDEILETSLEVGFPITPDPQVNRFLIKFSDTEISNVILNKISSSNNFTASLKCFIADVESLKSDTILDCFPISGTWDMGTGRSSDYPETQNGVSWNWRSYSGSNYWKTSSFSSDVTCSYSASVTPGGGNWWINFSGSSVNKSQSFGYYDEKDINFDVTNIITSWYSQSFPNDGFIIKQREEFINNINNQPKFKYYSRDTNTIYSPYLEFKWNDFIFNTGSSSMSILNNDQPTITISENPGIFYNGSINRFRINSRPQYPLRTYQTSSVYLTNYYLPTASYYALKDLKTNEFVINFDNNCTKISADSTSSYFDIDMNGLQNERVYTILIKTTIDNSVLIFDNDYHFKVLNS